MSGTEKKENNVVQYKYETDNRHLYKGGERWRHWTK